MVLGKTYKHNKSMVELGRTKQLINYILSE